MSNYTLEVSTSRSFDFKDRVGFTTGNVQDNNIKRTFNRAVAAVEAGQIIPVEAGSDEEYTVIQCFMRVRKSNPENVQAPSFVTADGENIELDDLIS